VDTGKWCQCTYLLLEEGEKPIIRSGVGEVAQLYIHSVLEEFLIRSGHRYMDRLYLQAVGGVKALHQKWMQGSVITALTC
jgi:hypothetical protein